MLAKIAQNDDLSVSEILEQVKKTGFDLSQLTDLEVKGVQNAIELQGNRQLQLHEHLSKLFQLSKISSDEQDILRTLAVLPYQPYHGKEELAVWFDFKNSRPFISLVKKGWLQRSEMSFSVHPVVGHVVKQEIKLKSSVFNALVERFNLFVQPGETEHWIEKSLWIPHLLVIINILDEESLITASSLNNLALLYKATGDYDQALGLYLRSLDIFEKVLGAEHPDVATSLNNLAGLYESTGDTDRALGLYLRSLDIREKVLGAEHPSTITVKENMNKLVLKLK